MWIFCLIALVLALALVYAGRTWLGWVLPLALVYVGWWQASVRSPLAFVLTASLVAMLAIVTGVKPLRLLERSGNRFRLEMGMGKPAYRPEEVGCRLDIPPGPQTVTLLNVGNPQCVLLVPEFPADWQEVGCIIESHPRFPRRTNVSFVRVLDRHRIDARFYERGAGPTLSSGTGATGAAVAAILSGRVESPVRVRTLAEDLEIEWAPGR